jgi:hypothetical protein
MTVNYRVLTGLLIIGGATLTALQLDMEALATFSTDLVHVVDNELMLQRAHGRCEELQVEFQHTQGRMAQKRQLAKEVIAGRLTLRQAAAQFEAMSRGVPYGWDHCAASHPEWPLLIRCAHYVIEQVEYEMALQPKEAPAVLAKLRAEKDAWQQSE